MPGQRGRRCTEIEEGLLRSVAGWGLPLRRESKLAGQKAGSPGGPWVAAEADMGKGPWTVSRFRLWT